MRNVTACRTAVWAGGATSPPDVALRVEVLLPGCLVLAVALVVALSAMLASGARAEDNRMMVWRLRKLACHRHVVFLPLLENEGYIFCPISYFGELAKKHNLLCTGSTEIYRKLYTKLVPILA
jgi:hypothetical protein